MAVVTRQDVLDALSTATDGEGQPLDLNDPLIQRELATAPGEDFEPEMHDMADTPGGTSPYRRDRVRLLTQHRQRRRRS